MPLRVVSWFAVAVAVITLGIGFIELFFMPAEKGAGLWLAVTIVGGAILLVLGFMGVTFAEVFDRRDGDGDKK